MHLTLTVNQVMARRCTNKEGESRASPPVVRHFQQSVPTSLIGINRQQKQAVRMAPVEISSRFYDVRLSYRDLRTYVWKRGFSEADKHPCGRDCCRAFWISADDFIHLIFFIFPFRVSFYPLWYQWHIWCNRISISLYVIFCTQV